VKIEPIEYRGWPEAYRCTAGPAELIVVTTIGPRILSLRIDGGENLLYEDTTGFKVGAWRLYGGHRLATAPESKTSYTPDNERCLASIEGNRLLIRQQLNGGVQRGLEIGPEPDRSGFRLRHVLWNSGSAPWHGAAWAITCVRPEGRVVLPGSGGKVRFWAHPRERYADASSAQWLGADGHFVVEPNGEKGKMGLDSERGWLALVRPDLTFIIRGPALLPEAAYPDGGCNVEVYTCSGYLELETLGPLRTLLPGQELSHLERWQVVPETFAPSEWRTIDRLGQTSRACQPPAGGGA
jgi:hypothetical protein